MLRASWSMPRPPSLCNAKVLVKRRQLRQRLCVTTGVRSRWSWDASVLGPTRLLASSSPNSPRRLQRVGQRHSDGVGVAGSGPCRLAHPLAASQAVRATGVTSPGQFDLQLVPVVAQLDLDLEADFVRDAHGDAAAVALKLDGVVAGERVGQVVQSSRGILTPKVMRVVDVEQVHVVSSVQPGVGWDAASSRRSTTMTSMAFLRSPGGPRGTSGRTWRAASV